MLTVPKKKQQANSSSSSSSRRRSSDKQKPDNNNTTTSSTTNKNKLDIDYMTVSLLRRTATKKQKDAKKFALKVQMVVLGARNVGKSSILSQYLFRRFETKYRPTVDDYYVRQVTMEDGTYRNLHLIDTAGPHDFPAMQRLWVQQCSAFVVVYSVCDPCSFHTAASILRQIHHEKQHGEKKSKEFHIVLVGNKADLLPDQQERVSRKWVRDLTDQYGCLYIETSAKHSLNIDSVFRCLLMKEVPPQLPEFFWLQDDINNGSSGGGGNGANVKQDVAKTSLCCFKTEKLNKNV